MPFIVRAEFPTLVNVSAGNAIGVSGRVQGNAIRGVCARSSYERRIEQGRAHRVEARNKRVRGSAAVIRLKGTSGGRKIGRASGPGDERVAGRVHGDCSS